VGVRIDAEWPPKITSAPKSVTNPKKFATKPTPYAPSESYIQGPKKPPEKISIPEKPKNKFHSHIRCGHPH